MSTMKPIKVVVADDHTIVREGIVSLLREGGCQVLAEAADGLDAVEKTLKFKPDVVVMDMTMPRLSGLEAVRRIHESHPEIRLLVLTVHEEEEYIIPMVRAGASGYLVKDSATSELLSAVRALHQGQAFFGAQASKVLAEQYQNPNADPGDPYGSLTPREREVFHLVAEGRSTKEVARLLDISVKTAENHRSRVIDKLRVQNTAGLVRYAVMHGLIT